MGQKEVEQNKGVQEYPGHTTVTDSEAVEVFTEKVASEQRPERFCGPLRSQRVSKGGTSREEGPGCRQGHA